jgi:luciferase family oxidoreductase group 1
MTRFSLLDLVPVVEGGTVAQSLANAADLARHAETLGYQRYWVAEHHGMRGIASAATAVVIGHIAAATSRIRVGAGGIMLPNHAPLVIAEQFGTLDALFPGRIDLGLGRAPGSDQRVARAMRRTLETDPNAFPQDVMELQSYFADDGRTGIAATPGAGANVPLWILGSSTFGAQGASILDHVLQCSAVGSPATVARQTAAFIERTGVDEVMVASAIYDHDARKRSLAITAEVMSGLTVPA